MAQRRILTGAVTTRLRRDVPHDGGESDPEGDHGVVSSHSVRRSPADPNVAAARRSAVRSIGAGDQTRDLGQAAVGLSAIGIAFLLQDYPVDLAAPLPDELRAGFEPALAQGGQN